MKFIFSTGSLYTYSPARCFEFAAQAGFDGIELMVDHRWDTRQPDYLLRLIDTYQLPILAVHSPFRHVFGWPRDKPALIQKSIKLAETVGAQVVVHHLPLRISYATFTVRGQRLFLPLLGWNKERAYYKWLQNDYQALQDSTNVRLCIENMPGRRWFNRQWNAHHWNSIEEMMRFPSLTMDTTHLATWGVEPALAYAHWQEKVGHIHLSNHDGRQHRLPEIGHLQLDQLLAQLREEGYQGAVSFELQPDALQAGSSDERIIELLKNSLIQCRTWAEGGRRNR